MGRGHEAFLGSRTMLITRMFTEQITLVVTQQQRQGPVAGNAWEKGEACPGVGGGGGGALTLGGAWL